MGNSFFGANKHRLFKYLTVSFVGVFMVLGTVIAARSGLFKSPNVEADEPTYTITLDDSNAASGLTSEYNSAPVTNTLPAKGDYSLTLTYTLAKKEANSHVTLATHGFMYN